MLRKGALSVGVRTRRELLADPRVVGPNLISASVRHVVASGSSLVSSGSMRDPVVVEISDGG